jgi:hypothetical protein
MSAGVDSILKIEAASGVRLRGATRIDMKAHRRIQPPTLNYDSLHAEHNHRGEHLLSLPGESASRKRYECSFRITAGN